MKKIKFEIFLVVLFMTIGIATVSSNIVLNGTAFLASSPDDFYVYFSDVLVDGEQDFSYVESATKLVFDFEFKTVDDSRVIQYDVTNSSNNYDADITISCTDSNQYLTINNSFDTSNYLSARSTKTGILTISLANAYVGDVFKYDISCTISASAVERDSYISDSVVLPLSNYYVGKEISIGSEKFNVLSYTDKTVTMLAKYNLGPDMMQSEKSNPVAFSDDYGWSGLSDLREIDIWEFSKGPAEYIEQYLFILSELVNDDSITGDLITVDELNNLGCDVDDKYRFTGFEDCSNSPYKSWLLSNQSWWTKSANSGDSQFVGVVSNPDVWCTSYSSTSGIRPVITISKDALNYINSLKKYEIGEIVVISDKGFNVIEDNGATITLLDQSASLKSDSFSYGWEYTPGPKEIDLLTWGGESFVNDVNSYINKLKDDLGTSFVMWDVLTLEKLGSLGCIFPSDYAFDYGVELETFSCLNSPYSSWLISGYMWWTKSADSNSEERIWLLDGTGYLQAYEFWVDTIAFRSLVTVPKCFLNMDLITFRIEDRVYTAPRGITWGEWFNTAYNTTVLEIYDGYVSHYNGPYACNLTHSSSVVLEDDVILADSSYFLQLTESDYMNDFAFCSPVEGESFE